MQPANTEPGALIIWSREYYTILINRDVTLGGSAVETAF